MDGGGDSENDRRAVTNLMDYIRIESVHPDVDYGPCQEWLTRMAVELDLPLRAEAPTNPSKPVLVITWAGRDPKLPSLMLNSHMDVVPVYPDLWTHGPFSAERTEDGNIYGRGTQDMKSVGVQYIEAVRRLRSEGFRPRRTVHIVFVPDEEVGGDDGMKAFVQTKAFADMNVGFELDEGMAYPAEEFVIFYTERSIWHVEFVCPGSPGHGALLMDNVAAEKVRVILNKLMDYRSAEKARIKSLLYQGDVTSVNVTILKGGVQSNVVPPEMSVTADFRVAPTFKLEEFVQMLEGWCKDAGSDVTLRYIQKGEPEGVTSLDDSNPWWTEFKKTMDCLRLKLLPIVCPGGTDARYVRRVGIPAIGFSPMNKTPLLLHDHDEFINEKVFLEGINIYKELIRNLSM